jgi:type VII secretion integral membrane protein EccD
VSAPSTNLTRVTIAAPRRRLDVALPDRVPLAELLPELLQRAGEELADAGAEHDGWVLRRSVGDPLAAVSTLASADVQDGEVLHLVPSRLAWPDLEYDDVVEAIAAGVRGLGSPWSAPATRVAGVLAAGAVVAAALLGPLRAGVGAVTPLALAATFLIAAVLAVRAYGEVLVGACLGGYGLPLSFLGGIRLVGAGPIRPAHLLGGGAVLAVWSLATAVAVARGLRVFAAGAVAGVLAAAGAALGTGSLGWHAAAPLAVTATIGVLAAPTLAVRLGRLPLPVVVLPPGTAEAPPIAETPEPPGDGDPATADPDRLDEAVARSDELLAGLLLGSVLTAVAAVAVLIRTAGPAGQALAIAVGLALLTRARTFAAVRQRVPLLAGGSAALLLAVFAGVLRLTDLALGPAVALAALGLTVAGARYHRRAPSPYLGRAADVLDVVCLLSVVPLAAWVLGLYGQLKGLSG